MPIETASPVSEIDNACVARLVEESTPSPLTILIEAIAIFAIPALIIPEIGIHIAVAGFILWLVVHLKRPFRPATPDLRRRLITNLFMSWVRVAAYACICGIACFFYARAYRWRFMYGMEKAEPLVLILMLFAVLALGWTTTNVLFVLRRWRELWRELGLSPAAGQPLPPMTRPDASSSRVIYTLISLAAVSLCVTAVAIAVHARKTQRTISENPPASGSSTAPSAPPSPSSNTVDYVASAGLWLGESGKDLFPRLSSGNYAQPDEAALFLDKKGKLYLANPDRTSMIAQPLTHEVWDGAIPHRYFVIESLGLEEWERHVKFSPDDRLSMIVRALCREHIPVHVFRWSEMMDLDDGVDLSDPCPVLFRETVLDRARSCMLSESGEPLLGTDSVDVELAANGHPYRVSYRQCGAEQPFASGQLLLVESRQPDGNFSCADEMESMTGRVSLTPVQREGIRQELIITAGITRYLLSLDGENPVYSQSLDDTKGSGIRFNTCVWEPKKK